MTMLFFNNSRFSHVGGPGTFPGQYMRFIVEKLAVDFFPNIYIFPCQNSPICEPYAFVLVQPTVYNLSYGQSLTDVLLLFVMYLV